MQSVPITTKYVISNPVHGEVYSIQHYVMKFVSDLRQVGGFLWVLRVSSTNKTCRHDIIEILLRVALNTINRLNQPIKNALILNIIIYSMRVSEMIILIVMGLLCC